MQTEVTARHSDLSEKDNRALISVFSAYTVTATLWLLFATGVGLLIAFKFGAPEFGPGAWLTFGRLRPIHPNATFYGFASIALVGLGYYVAARSCGTKLYNATLAWTGRAFSHLRPRSSVRRIEGKMTYRPEEIEMAKQCEEYLLFLRVRGAPARRRYCFTRKNGARARGGARGSLI
jgi:hypothetical protein